MKKRNITLEKISLRIVVNLGFLTFLMTITLFLYAIFTILFNSRDDIYIIGISAGIAGAFWSKGIGILDNFNKKIEERSEWISYKEYKKHLKNWIIFYIFSAFAFAIMWILLH